MKVKILCWLPVFFLFACHKEKLPDTQFTDLMCEQVFQEIAVVPADFRLKHQEEGVREEDLRKLSDYERIASWKRKFLENRNKASLLQYTDSVIHNLAKLKIPNYKLKKLDWDNSFKEQPNLHQLTIFELQKSRENYLKTSNEVNQKLLYLWALRAELNCHYNDFYEKYSLVSEYLAWSPDRIFMNCFNTVINAREVKVGEPVCLYVKLSTEADVRDAYDNQLRFEPVRFWLKNLKTKEQIPLKPVRIKWYFILQSDPIREKGDYAIQGNVKLGRPFPGPVSLSDGGLSFNSPTIYEPFKVFKGETYRIKVIKIIKPVIKIIEWQHHI